MKTAGALHVRINEAIYEFLGNTVHIPHMQAHTRGYFDIAHAAVKQRVPPERAVQETQALIKNMPYLAPLIFSFAKAAIIAGGHDPIHRLQELRYTTNRRPLNSRDIIQNATKELKRKRRERT